MWLLTQILFKFFDMNLNKTLVRSSLGKNHNTFAVYSYGGTTKYPLYTVEEFSANKSNGRANHSILHVCSGKYAKENAFKRFRMFAFGKEYRTN